ncbi:hypothetical protein RF11_02448 [Thelohanellus kitauei]|uniref:Tc1-like transposase DDE domain-containing protein n=1 Tax=Thelohanellus kitauei TaxID=669202 RepID=A0A0C2ILE1_THEKT|nr:hypothetical protein RF11_02448 [Thelohanellus kitauei]
MDNGESISETVRRFNIPRTTANSIVKNIDKQEILGNLQEVVVTLYLMKKFPDQQGISWMTIKQSESNHDMEVDKANGLFAQNDPNRSSQKKFSRRETIKDATCAVIQPTMSSSFDENSPMGTGGTHPIRCWSVLEDRTNEPYTVVMDNAPIHQAGKEFYDSYPYDIKYLPAYSPFLDPYEDVFFKVKTTSMRRSGPLKGNNDLTRRMINACQEDNIRDAYYEKYEKLIDIISSSEYKIQLFINEISFSLFSTDSLYPEVQNNPEMDTSTNKTDCGEGISIFNELAYLSYRLEQFRLCEDLSKIKLVIKLLYLGHKSLKDKTRVEFVL